MIPYEVYCRVRQLHREGVLSYTQIAQELNLHPDTVSKYAAMESFTQRRSTKRASKLDAYKPIVVRWLERYPYSAAQSTSAYSARKDTPAVPASSKSTCGRCDRHADRLT